MAYSIVALDMLPALCNSLLLQRLARGLALGLLASGLGFVYGLEAASAAIRRMVGAKHVGKIVLTAGTSGPWEFGARPGRQTPGHDLAAIAGGMGSLGSLSAAWMLEGGVNGLLLLGRSGRHANADAPRAQCRVAFVELQRAHVAMVAHERR